MGSIQVKFDDSEFLNFADVHSEQDKIELVHKALSEKAELDIFKEAKRRSDAIKSGEMETVPHADVVKALNNRFTNE